MRYFAFLFVFVFCVLTPCQSARVHSKLAKRAQGQAQDGPADEVDEGHDKDAEEAALKEVCKDVSKDLSWSIDELGKDIKDATPDKKKAIKESIARLKRRIAELKELVAGKIVEAAATAAAVKRMVAESIVALGDRMANAAGEAKEAVKAKIQQLNNQIVSLASAAKAKMVRAATIAAETVIAVKDVLVDRIGELSDAMANAAEASKKNIQASIDKIQTQLGQISDAASDKAAQAFAVAMAVKDMMSDKVAELSKRASNAAAEAKVKLDHRIADMQKRIDAMKISAYEKAVAVGATMNAIKELVSESLVSLGESLAEATAEAKEAIKLRIAMFKGRMNQIGSVIRAKATEAAVFAKDTFVAVKDMISENLNDMRLALKDAADDAKANIQEGIENLQVKMAALSAAAGDKAAEAYAGAAAVTAMLAANIVSLHAQARDAVGDARDAINARAHELGVQLVEMRAAAYQKVVDVGAFLVASKELVSEKIIELHERIRDSAAETGEAIKRRVVKLQARAVQFGSAALATLRTVVVATAATIMAVTELIGEQIADLADRIANSAAVAELKHQYEIRMEDMKKRLAVLKASASNKMAAAAATAAAVKDMMAQKISDMGEAIKTASIEKKAQLEAGIANLHAGMKEMGAYTMDRIMEAPAMAMAVKDMMADQIYALGQKMARASAAAKAAIKEKIDRLQVKLVDMGYAALDLTKKAIRMTIDAVVAVKDMAADKLAALGEAIKTASAEAKVELKARAAKLRSQLADIAEATADKAAEAKACAVAMAALIGEQVSALTQRLSEAAAEKKEQLLMRIDDLNARWAAMKSSAYDTAVDVGATMNAVKELVAEQVVELGERLAVATGEAAAALKRKLVKFQGQLSRIGTAVKDSLVNAAVIAAATVIAIKEMVSDGIAALGVKLSTAAGAAKEHIQERMAQLRENLQQLRGAAGDRVKQAAASAAAMKDMVGEKLSNLRDQLAAATEERKAELAIRLADMEKRWNAMTAAFGDRVREAMATVSATKDMLAESIVELGERLKTATGDAVAAIKAKMVLARGRIGQIGDAVKEKMIQAASVAVATIVALKAAVEENLIELKERLAKAPAQAKAAIKQGIENLKSRLSDLRKSAGDKVAEAVASASAVKEMVVESIALLHEQLREAASEKKKQILASIESMQNRLGEIKDSARDKVVQAAATMAAVAEIVGEQLVEMKERMKTASAEMKVAMALRIKSMQNQLSSLAEAAKEKAAEVLRAAAATVVAVGQALADKVVEMKERIENSALVAEARYQAEKSLENFKALLSNIKSGTVDAAAKAAACAVAMKDMIADSYVSLKEQIKTAAADAKLKLMLRAEDMKLRLAAMRDAAGDQMLAAAETASAVKTYVAEQIVSLHDSLKSAGAAAAKKIREKIGQLQQHLVDFGSALRDKLVEAAASIVAVKEMLADNIAKLREQLGTAAEMAKAGIEAHIAKLGANMRALKNAAGDKAAEAIAGAAAMKEMVEENLAAMYEHLKLASAEKKAQIEAGIVKLKAKLVSIGQAGRNMVVEVGATIAAAQELISESIAELSAELDTATAERRAEIEASIAGQYEKFGWLVDPFGIGKKIVTSTGWMQSKCQRKRTPEDKAACFCRMARSEGLSGEDQIHRCASLSRTTFELAGPWACAVHPNTERCSPVYPTFMVHERDHHNDDKGGGDFAEQDLIPVAKMKEAVQNCSVATKAPEQASCICDIANQLEMSEKDMIENCAALAQDALKVVKPWACAVHHETENCVPVYDDKSFDDMDEDDLDDDTSVDCGDVSQSTWWLDHKEFYSALFDIAEDESGEQSGLKCRFFSKKHECLDTTAVSSSPKRPPFIKTVSKTGVDSWWSNVWSREGTGKFVSLECGSDGRWVEPTAIDTQQCAYSLRLKYLAKPGQYGPDGDQKRVLAYQKNKERVQVEEYESRYSLDQLWVFDDDGFIRSAADTSMCMTGWSPNAWFGRDGWGESSIYMARCNEGWDIDGDWEHKWWIGQEMAWDMREVQKAGTCVRPNSCCSLSHAKHSSTLGFVKITGKYFLKFPHTENTRRVKIDDLKILKGLKMVLEDEENTIIDFWKPEVDRD